MPIEHRAEVAGVGIGAYLAGIAMCGKPHADEVVHAELVRAGDVGGPVERIADRSSSDAGCTSLAAIGWMAAVCDRRTVSPSVAESAIPSTNSKNWVARTMEYGRSDSLISFSWAHLARK